MPAAVAGATLMWLKKIHKIDADFDMEHIFEEPEQLEHQSEQ
jgi:hypothetical protein